MIIEITIKTFITSTTSPIVSLKGFQSLSSLEDREKDQERVRLHLCPDYPLGSKRFTFIFTLYILNHYLNRVVRGEESGKGRSY